MADFWPAMEPSRLLLMWSPSRPRPRIWHCPIINFLSRLQLWLWAHVMESSQLVLSMLLLWQRSWEIKILSRLSPHWSILQTSHSDGQLIQRPSCQLWIHWHRHLLGWPTMLPFSFRSVPLISKCPFNFCLPSLQTAIIWKSYMYVNSWPNPFTLAQSILTVEIWVHFCFGHLFVFGLFILFSFEFLSFEPL